MFNEDVQISGDTELGQKVKALFNDLDIDWEGYLAQFTGDIIAYKVGSLVKRSWSRTCEFQQTIQMNTTEYVQDELRITPCHEEVEDFYHDIDELVLDVERLKAHLDLLKAFDENDETNS